MSVVPRLLQLMWAAPIAGLSQIAVIPSTTAIDLQEQVVGEQQTIGRRQAEKVGYCRT